MLIHDLEYLKEVEELPVKPETVIGGYNPDLFNQVNLATISQLSIAISYGGTANASTYASINQSNSFNNLITSRSLSLSIT
jgi:hypothetical protein